MNFRTRNEELEDRIALIKNLDIVLPDHKHRNSKDLQTVQTFLKNDTVKFANSIISGLMQHNMCDVDFNYTYFKYDPQNYEAIMKECIKDFSENNDFSETFKIPLQSKSILQSIIGYKAIFELLQDNINYCEQLVEKLMELCSLPTFSELSQQDQDKVKAMIESINDRIEGIRNK